MGKEIILLKQTNNKELYASDIRNISYILNGIETLHKICLFHSNRKEDWKNLSTSDRKKAYQKEYRIKVKSINKNSPIEIELIVKGLFYSFELLNIFLSDDEQFENLKQAIKDITDYNLDAPENQKEQDKIKRSFIGCKKIIKVLGIISTIN